MTAANESIAEVASWIAESSKPRCAPFGDPIPVGPFAVLVPVALDAPVGSAFNAQALPLWVPVMQLAPGAAWPALVAPAGQPSTADRLAHLLWKVEQGQLPPCFIVGITSPPITLQDVVNSTEVDLEALPLLCAPLWTLPDDARPSIEAKLTAIV